MDPNQTSPSNQPQSKRNRMLFDPSQTSRKLPPQSAPTQFGVSSSYSHFPQNYRPPQTTSGFEGVPPTFNLGNVPNALHPNAIYQEQLATQYDPNISQYSQILQGSYVIPNMSQPQSSPIFSSPSPQTPFFSTTPPPQFSSPSQPRQQSPPRVQEDEGEQWMNREEMKKSGRKSAVWVDFILNKNLEVPKAKCIHCLNIYSAKSKGGTGHLKRHQDKCEVRNRDRSQPSITEFMENPNPLPYTYSYEDARLALSRMVVQTEQSFLFAEGRPFNKYISTIQPEHKLTGRKTIRSDALKQFIQRKAMLISEFANLSCKVNLTSDCWDSGVEYHYICVTAHWIDDDWILQKRIIGFQPIEFPHNATNISNLIMSSIIEFGLKDKILSCTFDNASAMTLTAHYLKNQLGDQFLDGRLFHVRCACHILNLCVKDGQKGLLKYHEKFKTIVKTINSCKSRRQDWKKHCHSMGVTYRRFPIDCDTRWNSTYEMLKACLEYKHVLTPFWNDKYPDEDSRLTDDIWEKMAMYVEFLVLFYNCTKTFSHVYTPIASTFLINIFLISKLFAKYRNVADYKDFLPDMESKFLKYWEQMPLIYIFACILDPRIKYERMVGFLIQYWSNTEQTVDEGTFRTKTYDLFISFFDVYDSRIRKTSRPIPTVRMDVGSSSSFDSSNLFATAFNALDGLDQGNFSSQSSSDLSEWQMYLKFDFLKGMSAEEQGKLDLLQWWRSQRRQFPVMSTMARDVFSVQVSSVASERAFSASGRVLDDKRTRMNSTTLEMLVCYKDWLDAEDRNQDNAQYEVESDDSGYASSTQTNPT